MVSGAIDPKRTQVQSKFRSAAFSSCTCYYENWQHEQN
jgi:hypothetical protein